MWDASKRMWHSNRTQNILWWLGIPLFVACVTVFPFFLAQCVYSGNHWSCLRVSTVGPVIFDLWTYLEAMGSSIVRQ